MTPSERADLAPGREITNGSKTRSFYANAAVLLVNTCLAFIVVNLVIYLAFASRDLINGSYSNYGGVVLKRLKLRAFINQVYPDLDLKSIEQLLDETWSRPLVYEAYTQFAEHPFKGRFVNVSEAGYRVTKNQGAWPPSPKTFNVYLFGGSTTFGYGVPDDQTVASYLQEQFAGRSNRDVRVYNFGRGYFRSTQERILFQEMLLGRQRPDMAIFMDGLNDFARDLKPDFTPQLEQLFKAINSPWRVTLAQSISSLPISQLAEGVSWRFARHSAAKAPDAEGVDGVRARVDRYLGNKKQIEAIGREFGVPAIFIWQPVPWYRYDQKYYLYADDRGGDPVLNYFRHDGYPRMQEALALSPADPKFLWCADIQESASEPLYVDRVHYTAAMSRRLAEHIARVMTERGLMPLATAEANPDR